MRNRISQNLTFATAFILLLTAAVFAQFDNAEGIYGVSSKIKGKTPVIIVPGIMGSELVNVNTGEKVWFKVGRSNDDDLRLPVALNLNLSRDSLLPGDILRKVNIRFFPDVDVYEGIIDSLTKGGYEEASWENPPKDLYDKFFVFPYDWRRDNQESARYLVEEIEDLKRRTGYNNLKFNVLAHSMGGLIVRYAAMYGKLDLRSGVPMPTWYGAKHFARLFIIGTPNEGSADALRSLLQGQSSFGGTTKIPFVRFLTPIDIATMPSVFQLLPHIHSSKFFDGDLKPLSVNLYDINTWKKYDWAIYGKDQTQLNENSPEFARFERYFALVLKRASQFQAALDAQATRRGNLEISLIGGDCKPTLDGIVIYKNDKGEWETISDSKSFRNSNGVKHTDNEVRSIIFAEGDGSVTKSSLFGETKFGNEKQRNVFDENVGKTVSFLTCVNHEGMTSNPAVQVNILQALVSDIKHKNSSDLAER
ncbi:MAG: esterase/lipase family protein [Pyrinomonadaceae bacterium]